MPVVPVAINIRMYMLAKFLKKKYFSIKSIELEKSNEPSTDSFKIDENEILKQGFFGNYFRGIINIMIKLGLGIKLRGMEVRIKSDIPIGSGLASSAALEVSFLALLNYANNLGFSKKEIAEVAFRAETEEVGVPCGRLDQYGVSYGEIIKLDCRPPYHVTNLPFRNLTFAIIDSGIKHSTLNIHPKRQSEINEGLKILMNSSTIPKNMKKKLGSLYNQPIWEEIKEKNIQNYLSILDKKTKRRFLFTLRMQILTDFALKILNYESISKTEIISNLGKKKFNFIKNSPDIEFNHLILGEVMNKQQMLLRNFYDVSLPKVDEMCKRALEAGAYGAKISGAGMGGSIIALVKNNESGKNVVDACLSIGAKNGWVSKVGEGVKIEGNINPCLFS